MSPHTRQLELKSIWDESLLEQVVPNKIHLNKLYNYLIQHSHCQIVLLPLEEWCIPKKACERIRNEFVNFTSKVTQANESSNTDTTKLLVQLQDGHKVETVVIKHKGHSTVCVSSQIGCKMGCKFCATGTMGIIGDLTSGEIIEQLVLANDISPIRNVVFMGMGEPLNNYENLARAVKMMIDNKKFGLSPKHVTVSTVGVVKNMNRLSTDIPNVNMALSLHAPNQAVRVSIVPSASANRIDRVMAAVDYHIEQHTAPKARQSRDDNQQHTVKPTLSKPNKGSEAVVMIEYILISGVNDLAEHAHELGQLLSVNNRRPHIFLNLIPYNPTAAGDAHCYKPPTRDQVQLFHGICKSAPYELHTRVRQEMGQDIAGACGQLALVNLSNINSNSTGTGAAAAVDSIVASSSSSAQSVCDGGDDHLSSARAAASTTQGQQHRDIEDCAGVNTTARGLKTGRVINTNPVEHASHLPQSQWTVTSPPVLYWGACLLLPALAVIKHYHS